MNIDHVCSAVTRYMKELTTAGIGFEAIFRVTVGQVTTIVNGQLLHQDPSCRSLYRKAREALASMSKLPDEDDGYGTRDLSVFSMIYGDLRPLADAICEEDELNGALAVRAVDVIACLFDAWSAWSNENKSLTDRQLDKLTGVMMKTCAWHVALSATNAGVPVPFASALSYDIVDDDPAWLEMYDEHISEYVRRLQDVKESNATAALVARS